MQVYKWYLDREDVKRGKVQPDNAVDDSPVTSHDGSGNFDKQPALREGDGEV